MAAAAAAMVVMLVGNLGWSVSLWVFAPRAITAHIRQQAACAASTWLERVRMVAASASR